MKITIVQGAFLPVPPLAGGAVEKLWFDLGLEFARRGLSVTHVSRNWPGLPQDGGQGGVVHRRVQGYNYPRNRVLAKLMDLAYSIRCLFAIKTSDIVVTNTFFLPMLLSWFRRQEVIYVSVHRFPQGQMRFYRRVARIQCVSTVIADAVREQAPAIGRLVKVVPNYVSSRLDSREAERDWDRRHRDVLFVGRLHPEKGVDLLIRAFGRIAPDARKDWKLRIVGPHDTAAGGGGQAFLDSLKRLAQELRVDVDWVGPVYDRGALEQTYRRARVFIYPSIAAKGEAFPLAPLEAMAQGCAVVTSDLACFDDFVRPGVNAATFALDAPDTVTALAEVLAALIADPERIQAYSRAGLKTVDGFLLPRVADAFVEDFASLLNA